MFTSAQRCAHPRIADAGARTYGHLVLAVADALSGAKTEKRVPSAAFLAWSTVHGAAMLLLDRPLAPLLVGVDNPDTAMTALVEHATDAVATG